MIKQETDNTIEAIRFYEASFLKVIYENFGIVIQVDQTAELLNAILEGCNKFALDPQAYLEFIKKNGETSPIVEHLISRITIGETYFFRDKRQMHLLEKVLLPRLIEKKEKENNFTLRIWSAACSSGDEIYTLAILLKELIPNIHHWTIHLLGTDINKHALKIAEAGQYSNWSIRSISDFYKNKFFIEEKNTYILKDEIKKMAKFHYLNLHDNKYPAILNNTHAQDLILCRNVMIYFDNEVVLQIMKRLSQSLVSDGYLILGASDPVVITDTGFSFLNENGAIYFQRNN